MYALVVPPALPLFAVCGGRSLKVTRYDYLG